MKLLPAVIAVLAVTLLATSDVRGQESNAPPPEMKVLQKMVGAWRGEAISKVAESTPEETRGKGTSKADLVLGGHFLLNRWFDSQGKLKGIQLFTYDKEQQVYRLWSFHDDGFAVERAGEWDEGSNTLTLKNEIEGMASVSSIHFADEHTILWTLVFKDQEGKVYLDMHGKEDSSRLAEDTGRFVAEVEAVEL